MISSYGNGQPYMMGVVHRGRPYGVLTPEGIAPIDETVEALIRVRDTGVRDLPTLIAQAEASNQRIQQGVIGDMPTTGKLGVMVVGGDHFLED